MSLEPPTPRTAFLGQFEPELIPFFHQFCEAISSLSTDVIMYTARKAVCLYESARELGLLDTSAITTSDRILDMDLAWLRGKTITIVDDILITGSSLYRAQHSLENAGCANVDVMALAVDQDSWVSELVSPKPPYVTLPNRRAIGLCTQIVDAISLVPRPYNIDWPLLMGVSALPDRKRGLNFALGDWRTRNVASPLQEQHGVYNVTYTPSDRIMHMMQDRLGIPLHLMTLSKVRAYLRPLRGQGGWDIRATPIVHFESLSERAIDRIFSATGEADCASEQFSSRSARLRALQYRASLLLGEAWCHEAAGVVFAAPPTVDDSAARFLVGPSGIDCLHNEWPRNAGPILADVVDATKLPPLPIDSSARIHRDATQNELQDVLTRPFMDLYMTKELPAREILLSEGKAALGNEEYRKIVDRLSEGYSAGQLENIVSTVSDDSWGPLALSTFLDIAIDHGMVVPITQEKGGYVRRAFRHGEDIVFGLQERRLFSIALRSAADVLPDRTIGRREVEKICVLFLKIGLQRQVLQPWFGRLGRANTAGVRWHLKGALVQASAESLFGASLDKGLTHTLVKDGILKRGKTGNFVVSEFDSWAPTGPVAEGTAEIVGAIFGQLLSAEGADRLTAGEITLLASCDSLLSLVGALAAEVSIAANTWPTLEYLLLGRNEKTLVELDQRLRKSDLFEAMNSGAWKHFSVMSGKPKRIIDRVAASLDGLYRIEWKMFWQNLVDAGDMGSPQLSELASRLGRWLYAMVGNLHLVRGCYALLMVRRDDAQRFLSAAEKWADRHAAERRVETTELIRRVRQARGLEQAGDPAEVRDLLDRSLREISELIRWAPSMLDQARILTQSLSRPATIVHYTSALVLRVIGDAKDRRAFGDDVARIFASARRASSGRPYRLEQALEIVGCPADYVFVARGERAGAALRRLGEEMLKIHTATRVTGYLVPVLGPTEQVFSTDTGLAFKGDGFADMVRVLMEGTLGETASSLKIVTHGPMTELVRRVVGARSPVDNAERNQLVLEEIDMTSLIDDDRADADVGIVTIISEETRAVVDWLKECQGYRRRVSPQDGTVFYTACIDVNGKQLKLALTQAVEQGQTSMAMACQQLQGEFGVAFNVVLGIGGSVHKDAALGDVVLAHDIIDYGPVALTAEGPKHRGLAFRPPVAVAKGLNDFFALGDDPRGFRAGDLAASLGKTSFKLLRGPIGTGYAVVKFRESDVRKWLDGFNEKTLVVETEGEGIARYFYEMAERMGLAGYIVLRVISDHADEDKDDKWKLGACQNGVIALQALLPTIAETVVLKEGRKGA